MDVKIFQGIFSIIIILLLAPLFAGIVNKFKAIFTGRVGAPFYQPYFELLRLYKKETINASGASFISRVSPVINFVFVIIAAIILPVMFLKPIISFQGDIILFAYILGTARFFQIMGAMDIGSSFEGMGAAREALFALFAEPIFFFSFGSIAFISGYYSFYDVFTNIKLESVYYIIFIVICSISVFMLAVTECSRMPIDDPNTHLELTMIHEVMILDNSGFDLFLYQYGSYIKLLVYTILEISLFYPFGSFSPVLQTVIFLGGFIFLSAFLALIETITSRYKLKNIPLYLLFTTAIGLLNIVIYTFTK